MESRFNGRSAIVTGAASGMGQATALRLAAEGACVCLADVDEAGNQKTLASIRAVGGEAFACQCDVTDEASVVAMAVRTEQAYGPVRILFNNAGIEDHDGNSDELSVDNWDRIQAVNTRGVFLVAKHAIQSMLRGGGGVITSTSSIGGLIGGPGLHSYSASKGAVISLTRALAVTYARQGIRANAICPGLVLTPMVERIGPQFLQMALGMTPLGRGAEPSEVANLVAFLSSDEAGFITGSIIPIDGGFTAQ
ncbi:MAG: SDR family NAD(P)-dependent oxidoreductase [Immundisolibacter sp.]|uniref:SDR family NAD(P)-dependent oxidoreductase n=1 Tax=Immundisolibacter sp. TaxID=1934948 RepID=UPI003EDE98B9